MMMQSSKLALRVKSFVIPSVAAAGGRKLGAITGGGRTADPNVHAVDPEETNDASEVAKAAPPLADHNNNSRSEFKHATTSTKDGDPYVSPKIPTNAPKVRSTGVNQPPEPLSQQKRRRSTATVDVDCVGLDGSPLPGEEKEMDGRRQREEQEKDNKEYFAHHGASPLSEIEMADTRKPLTRATDGSADSGDYGNPEVVVWRPEQVDSAEDSLRGAREIWISNAVRGDPDSPHGRVLRTLRGELW